jgi:Transcription factor WhiB.
MGSPQEGGKHAQYSLIFLDARSLILMTWRNRSACLDEEPELFFPIGNTGLALVQIEEGKAVCRRCEVIEACLSWAIQSDQTAGMWGGMSEDERTALKRRDARAARRADQATHRH